MKGQEKEKEVKMYRTEKGRRVSRKIAINLMPVALSMLILIAAMIPLS